MFECIVFLINTGEYFAMGCYGDDKFVEGNGTATGTGDGSGTGGGTGGGTETETGSKLIMLPKCFDKCKEFVRNALFLDRLCYNKSLYMYCCFFFLKCQDFH